MIFLSSRLGCFACFDLRNVLVVFLQKKAMKKQNNTDILYYQIIIITTTTTMNTVSRQTAFAFAYNNHIHMDASKSIIAKANLPW